MTDIAPASRRLGASAGVLARWSGAAETGARPVRSALGTPVETQVPGSGLTIAVTDCPSTLEAEWLSFQETAVATYAQSYDWVAAWSAHVAPARPARPVIATGRFASGELAFIWPFALHKRFGRSALRWLGQDDSAYGMGLYALEFIQQVTPAETQILFRAVLKAIGGVDAVEFHEQPELWCGYRNPMLALPAQPSADLAYELPLDADFDTIYSRAFGKRSRTTFKRKERRLRREGTVEILNAKTAEQRREVLDVFYEQKAVQFAEQGIRDVFAEPAIQAFFSALSTDLPDRSSPLVCSAVTVDGKIAATVTGTRFQDRFNLLLASLTQAEVRRWSPGALLMRDQIAACCETGCTHYDLGPGWGPHKEEWGAQPIQLFDTNMAVRLSGNLVAVPGRLRLWLKRTIKSNKTFWNAFRNLRRRIFGNR